MKVLAFDFGASSGRAIVGELVDGCLQYEEIHRFENIPIENEDGLFWDYESFMKSIQYAIEKAEGISSVAFDTWGVDFGLLDENDNLVGNPYHYRDSRTEGILSKVEKIMPVAEIYEKTGNQVMEINTLFQLFSMKNKEQYPKAKTLLFMPDLFAFSLCGEKVCEKTIASTSQMFDMKNNIFDKEILEKLDIKQDIFPKIVDSGTVIGEFSNKVKVISVAGHDTQCAISALPSNDDDVAFLSSGTWSLLGTEVDSPIITDYKDGFSNEMGANGKINYLKNLTGLWLVQECKRDFEKNSRNYSFSELENLAREQKAFQCFIDVDSEEFKKPNNMPEKVREFCKKTGQYIPQNDGEVIRCIYESLAFKYKETFEKLSKNTGKTFKKLHILGGGAKASFLTEIICGALAVDIVSGPYEATAIGNMLIQLKTLGEVKDFEELREISAKCSEIKTFRAVHKEEYQDAYAKYKKFIKGECYE